MPRAATANAVPAHPTFQEMIKEAIIAMKDRTGISRPTIKSFLETRYQLSGGQTNYNISKALTTGAEKGIFVLPKGPSGKVKLPPKRVSENVDVPRRAVKKTATTTKAPAASTSAKSTKKSTSTKENAIVATKGKTRVTTTKKPLALSTAGTSAKPKTVPVKKAPSKITKPAKLAKKSSTHGTPKRVALGRKVPTKVPSKANKPTSSSAKPTSTRTTSKRSPKRGNV